MNGAQHYREAERLLSDASFFGTHGHPVSRDGDLLQPGQQAALIARAQVHAELAKAAAAVLPTIVRFMGDSDEVTRWAKATGAYDESAAEPMVDGVTDKRVAPAEWPPRLGDLWQDTDERAYFVVDARVDYDDDVPVLRLIAQWGETLDPDVAMREYGPLTLVRRQTAQGGELA